MSYKFRTEVTDLKDFRRYRNPVKLFKNLKGGNENPKEVFKFKSSKV